MVRVEAITQPNMPETLQGEFIRQTPYLQYAHMEVCLPEDTAQSPDGEVVFLYKFPLIPDKALNRDSAQAGHYRRTARTALYSLASHEN